MKKTLGLFTLCILYCAPADANIFWWEQPTVCKIDTTKCYISMGAGYDPDIWDATSKCRGMKYICPNAMIQKHETPVLVARKDIESKKFINSDFDIEQLSTSDDCFGRRKTSKDGTLVSVNGQYQMVWCSGILNTPDEILDNGEITYGKQPSCSELAKDGYIATLNNRCYGKYYDTEQHYIDCGTALLPKRIIILNGADYETINKAAPVTMNDAKTLFKKMYSNSHKQHEVYFAK